MADRGLRQAEHGLDVAGADLVLERAARRIGPRQELEDADAGGIAEGLEGGGCVVHVCQYIDRYQICQCNDSRSAVTD